jgi:hypothetical protein
MAGGAARLEVLDPGFVRSRRGARAVGATLLTWATMLGVTSVFDVADPVRITLFGVGACFTGALLATDSRPRDRVRVLCWATVVSSVAVVVTVELSRTATAWHVLDLAGVDQPAVKSLGLERSPAGPDRDPRNGQRFPATGIARLNIPSVNGHHFRAAGGGTIMSSTPSSRRRTTW